MHITKVAALPDFHTPRHDERCVKVVLKFLKEYKPDIVIDLGDFCDWHSLSRFDVHRESECIGFMAERDSANALMDRIDAVLGKKTRKVFLEGNHDHRAEVFRLNRWDADIRKLLNKPIPNYHELYNLEKRGWEYYDSDVMFQFGKCIFNHGFYTGKYHANKTVQRFFKTIVYGHTHTYQTYCVNGMDGNPVAGMSIGTLSEFNLPHTRGVPQDWVHMFMFMEFFDNGCFTPHPIPIINGSFSALGQIWRA